MEASASAKDAIIASLEARLQVRAGRRWIVVLLLQGA